MGAPESISGFRLRHSSLEFKDLVIGGLPFDWPVPFQASSVWIQGIQIRGVFVNGAGLKIPGSELWMRPLDKSSDVFLKIVPRFLF